jgi:hypothetical protein
MPALRLLSHSTGVLLVAASLFLVASTTILLAQQSDTPLHFESDVRPILKAHCFHCHGESDQREGGLDLRLVHLIKKGGESGSAISTGDANSSLIYRRVAENEMPPGGKHLSEKEKETLRLWISQGAPTKRAEPEIPPLEDWTEEERNYWAFQSVRALPPPVIPLNHEQSTPSEGARAPEPSTDATQYFEQISPVDAFLLDALRQQAMAFSPTADRRTLVRRLSYDLRGIPPSNEEIDAFVQDNQVDAYERLVDRFLADPRLGEHWGRHWLDLAGYADSDGYSEHDTERPWAFQYRDYVIKAHNDDLPIDRFIVEQLAGDELVPAPWDALPEEQQRILAATGFLRTAPDGTGHEGVDQNVARNDVLGETIKIVTGGLLGLTVGCAQCHDHRYDPISQRDYYRIRALFEPGLDWKNWREKPARLVNLWTAEERAKAAEVDKSLSELETTRLKELDEIVADIFEKEVMKLPEEQREAARTARNTAADKRTPEQQKLLRDFPSLNVDRGSAVLYDGARINEFNKKYETQQAEIRKVRPADSYLASFSEVPNQIPTTHLFFRGDIQQPRDPIPPGGLSILQEHDKIPPDDPQVPTSGRRLQFARLITSGVHPLLTRNLANRMWMHLFGRPLSNNPGDLGRLGEAPTHPLLLDWLANRLVEQEWSRKRTMRDLLLSHAYRQSSSKNGLHQEKDPQNQWLSRMPMRRLQAESLRDAMLATSGMLTYRMYGTPSAVNPDEVGQFILGKATRDGNGILVAKQEETADTYRRSIYTQVRRSMPLGVLEPFDPATLNPNCDRRPNSTVATQSLMMMNNSTVIKVAEHFSARVLREAGSEPAAQTAHAWLLAFGSQPSTEQHTHHTNGLIALRAELLPKELDPDPNKAQAQRTNSEQQALALYCQALLSSNAFLYVD